MCLKFVNVIWSLINSFYDQHKNDANDFPSKSKLFVFYVSLKLNLLLLYSKSSLVFNIFLGRRNFLWILSQQKLIMEMMWSYFINQPTLIGINTSSNKTKRFFNSIW